SHEEISMGFWPGSGSVAEPAFYAHTRPEPPALASTSIRPVGAYYSRELADFILPYEAVRSTSSPDDTVLDFYQSAYEAGADLGRPAVQSAVDVYLLVRRGPITAVFLRRLVRCRLHGREYLPRQSSAADRIEGHRGAGGDERLGQVIHEGWQLRVAHVGGADLLEDVDVLGLAHDVHQADAVLDADPVEHLPEIGGGRRVHERLVTFRAHGCDHPERGERIDEAGGALGRGGTRRQHQALHGLDAAVLRVHRAPEDGDGLAHQRLRCRRRPRLDDHPGPFVADGQRLLQTPGHRLRRCRWDARRHHGVVRRAGCFGGAHVSSGEKESLVGGIDGRGIDTDDYLLRFWLRRGDTDER